VLAPFVLPEGLVVTLVVLPVGLHVAQELGAAGRLQNLGDVGVGSSVVAIGFVCAIAVVRLVYHELGCKCLAFTIGAYPKAVDGPAV